MSTKSKIIIIVVLLVAVAVLGLAAQALPNLGIPEHVLGCF